jgi:hypothetical protein
VVNCGVNDCLDRLGLDADGSGVAATCFGGAGVRTDCGLAGVFVDLIVGRFPNDLDGFTDWDWLVLANNLLGADASAVVPH